jgi:hypothetical protein
MAVTPITISPSGATERRADRCDDVRADPLPCAYPALSRHPSRLPRRVEVRLEAESALQEAVAWFCTCGARVQLTEVVRGVAVHVFDQSDRRCASRVHPPAGLGDIARPETAAVLS